MAKKFSSENENFDEKELTRNFFNSTTKKSILSSKLDNNNQEFYSPRVITPEKITRTPFQSLVLLNFFEFFLLKQNISKVK